MSLQAAQHSSLLVGNGASSRYTLLLYILALSVSVIQKQRNFTQSNTFQINIQSENCKFLWGLHSEMAFPSPVPRTSRFHKCPPHGAGPAGSDLGGLPLLLFVFESGKVVQSGNFSNKAVTNTNLRWKNPIHQLHQSSSPVKYLRL